MHVLHGLVIEGLDDLADEDRQRRLWLSDGTDGEVSSLGEAWATTFDDSGLAVALERGSVYPDRSDSDLARLRQVLRRVPIKSPPEEIITSSVMADVRVLASSLATRLRDVPPVE
jgi:hypothetical protein